MMWRRSITLRLTLLFGASCAVVLLAMGYAISVALERHFEQQDLMLIRPKLEFATNFVSKLQSRAELATLSEQLQSIFPGHKDLSIVVATPDGKKLAGNDDLGYPQSLTKTFDANKGRTWREGSRSLRGIAAITETKIPGLPSVFVAMIVDIGSHEEFLHEFRDDLWIAVALSIGAAALMGWAAARWGLAPVHSMAALAKEITASRLQKRLAIQAVPHELAELARAFNGMLSRLEESFRRLSDFSSDLAHEMRTPIASLVTHTQVALSRSRSAEQYREVLYANLEMLDRMSRMTSDMLYLAKADNGLMVPMPENIDLSDEVAQLLDFYSVLAEEKDIRLKLEGRGTMDGDKLMVRRAISNLLSNAIRHATAGSDVTVKLVATTPGRVQLAIQNEGSDIPADAVPRLFQRFYRVDTLGDSAGEGTGLGLAISKAIVEAHRGTISVLSEEGTTTFTMSFPVT